LIEQIHEIYRYVYQKGYNTSQALERIERDIVGNGERDLIVSFIRESKRGIIKGPFEEL
jgi:UDP-N-acetylglucosamine acyltransferase